MNHPDMKKPGGAAPDFPEDDQQATGSIDTVAEGSDSGQTPGLFPVDEPPPIARPFLLATRGRVEYGVRCPSCKQMHRHIHLGAVIGPCGAEYEVRPRRAAVGRAA